MHVLTPFVDNGSVFSLFLKNFAVYTRFVAKMLVGPSLEKFLAAPMSVLTMLCTACIVNNNIIAKTVKDSTLVFAF